MNLILSLAREGQTLFKSIREYAQNKISNHLQKLELKDILILENILSELQKVLKKWD